MDFFRKCPICKESKAVYPFDQTNLLSCKNHNHSYYLSYSSYDIDSSDTVEVMEFHYINKTYSIFIYDSITECTISCSIRQVSDKVEVTKKLFKLSVRNRPNCFDALLSEEEFEFKLNTIRVFQ